MSSPAANTSKIYLAIAGNQTGPFSESQVVVQIKKNLVPEDALVWYEGLPDWQPILSIEFLKQAFTRDGTGEVTVANQVPATANPTPFKPLAESSSAAGGALPKLPSMEVGQSVTTRFAKGGDDLTLAFGEEGTFEKNKKPLYIIGGGVVALLLVVGSVYYFFFSEDNSKQKVVTKAFPKALSREGSLRQALSELLLKPDNSVQTLNKLLEEKSDDKIAKEAGDALIDYYHQRKRYGDAGRIYMMLKRPTEAAKMFLEDPPICAEADKALFNSYVMEKNKQGLIDDIKLLLGPLKNEKLASERIGLLQKDFPKDAAPYGYYLKTPAEKIPDLFQRISFYYVQELMSFLNTEIPEIRLASRPIVEIRRDKQSRYRIIGRYKGEVFLNQDRLENITFEFWLHHEQWKVVETNLTAERKRFSASIRERIQSDLYTEQQMLDYLETVFKTQFPKSFLHEKVSPGDKPAPSSAE